MNVPKYVEKDIKSITSSNNENLILILTATEVETSELHKVLQPLNDETDIVKGYSGNLTLFFGKFGRYNVVHIQCSMGSLSRDSSIMTTSEALNLLHCKVVIMIGIAFGVARDKQNIGDVLVAEVIQPYNNKRVSSSTEIQRGYAMPSSKLLFNRFKNLTNWEFFNDDEQKVSIHSGLILSGEELIDNKLHRDELIGKYPHAIGGEMEGIGVYAACSGKAEVILIKAICDFADGMKGVNKSQNQLIAIQAALSLCHQIFSSKTAFAELGINPSEQESIFVGLSEGEINNILFEIYIPSKEIYYLSRSQDVDFVKIIKHYGVWIYGISGCGKSSLISRNLFQENIEFIQVNLASCIDLTIEQFFHEIFFDIAGKLEGIHYKTIPRSFRECVKLTLDTLEKHSVNKQLIIFIEEIPLHSASEYAEFAQKLYSLLVSKSLLPGLDEIKFVLSSINDPTPHIQAFNQKIHSQLKFLKLDAWSINDIADLIGLINGFIKVPLEKHVENEIIAKSNRSPRFVKKFFRNLMALNNFDNTSINTSLIESIRELNQIQNG